MRLTSLAGCVPMRAKKRDQLINTILETGPSDEHTESTRVLKMSSRSSVASSLMEQDAEYEWLATPWTPAEYEHMLNFDMFHRRFPLLSFLTTVVQREQAHCTSTQSVGLVLTCSRLSLRFISLSGWSSSQRY